MPYFYVRNQNFIAVFREDRENKDADGKTSKRGGTICQVIPSPALSQTILDHPNLTFSVEKIFAQETDDQGEPKTKNVDPEEDDDDEPLDME